MEKETIEKYIEAGKIAKKAIELSKKIVKPGASILETAQKIESEITQNNGQIAFPTNISINDLAAHDTAFPNDTRTFKEDDIIKIDIGVHIDGYIADTATTISFNNNKADMLKASREALQNALKITRPGTNIGDIGKTIQETIESFGYKPVSNLSGHYLGQYKLHTGTSIPNIKTDTDVTLKEGDAIAIEPFATDGAGAIRDGSRAAIYRFIQNKPVRLQAARKLLQIAQKNYSTLPFAARWLKEPKGFMLDVALKQLVQAGALHEYPVLKEIGNGTVTQAEHTVLIQEKPIVTTA